MPELARSVINAMPCGLVSEVHSAILRAVELQSSDCRRTPSATHGRSHGRKKQNIRFSELGRICVVADFPVVFTVSIIMIRLRHIIESCRSFQTALFSGLRNISLQILRIVGRVWNEGSRMLCQRLPSPSTTTKRLVLQNLPSLGLPALIRPPPIWRVLNKLRCERLPNNKALQ